jgi:hypothetical protein
MLRKMTMLIAFSAALISPVHVSRFQTSDRDSYKMTMSAWGKDEQITISSGASELIDFSFQQNRGRLLKFGGDRKWEGTGRTLNQTLVIYYLGNLRDLKAATKKKPSVIPLPGSQVQGRPKTQTTLGEGDIDSIGEADVKAYPVNTFLGEIEPVLNGSKGELHVVSEPSGAAITLDTQSRGITEKITAERAGQHDIVVSSKKDKLQCKDKVVVPAGGSVTFHCP